MDSQEELFNRFKEVEQEISSLASAIQNPLEGYKYPFMEREMWLAKANAIPSRLSKLLIDTFTFMELNSDKNL